MRRNNNSHDVIPFGNSTFNKNIIDFIFKVLYNVSTKGKASTPILAFPRPPLKRWLVGEFNTVEINIQD